MALGLKSGLWKKILGYLFGLAILATIAYFGGLDSLKATYQPRIVPLFLAGIITSILFLISASRWGFIVNRSIADVQISYFDFYFYLLSARFFGQYISYAGGDVLVKPAFLRNREDINLKTGILTVAFDKFFDLVMAFIFLTPGALYFFKIIDFALALALGALVLLLVYTFGVVGNSVFRSVLSWGFSRLEALSSLIPFSPERITRNLSVLNREVKQNEILDPKMLVSLISFSVLKYIFLFLQLYVISIALKIDIPYPYIFLGIPVAQLSLIFSVTPGGLGILEGGWYALLSAVGVSQETSSTFLIGQRAYRMIFISGIFFLSYISFALKRAIAARESAP